MKAVLRPENLIDDLMGRYSELSPCRDSIWLSFEILVETYRANGKLLVCGNGGSAADGEHIVGELMKSFRLKRPVDEAFKTAYREVNGLEAPAWLEGSLPAIALSSHTALFTAFCNDESAVGVFAQQVYGYGAKGDTLLGISTSGTSQNVIEAAMVAKAREMKVVALTGEMETDLTRMADVAIRIPRGDTFAIQELHLPVYHCLCAMLEAEFFSPKAREGRI